MIQNRGFSLVELSIVLIIIGILVAGVSGGAKLIDNSRLRGVITEIQTIQGASNTFQLTYSQLAGDMVGAYDFFSAQNCGGGVEAACDGDNNKFLEGSGDGGYYREEQNFWEHLFFAGILTNVTPVGDGSTVYISNKFRSLTISADHVNFFSSRTGLRLGAQRPVRIASYPSHTYNNKGVLFTPRQAYQIDKKLDDGVPVLGKIKGSHGLYSDESASTSCNASGEYNILINTTECYIEVELEVFGL